MCVFVEWIALGRAYIVAKAGSTKCLASQEVNRKIENESKGKRKEVKRLMLIKGKEKVYLFCKIVLCGINMEEPGV